MEHGDGGSVHEDALLSQWVNVNTAPVPAFHFGRIPRTQLLPRFSLFMHAHKNVLGAFIFPSNLLAIGRAAAIVSNVFSTRYQRVLALSNTEWLNNGYAKPISRNRCERKAAL